MATKIEIVQSAEVSDPQPEFLSEQEWLAMRESYSQERFGMSVEEFFKAWEAGKFKGNRELHDSVVALAMMIPEAWDSDAW